MRPRLTPSRMTGMRDDGAGGAQDGAVATAADQQVGAGDMFVAGAPSSQAEATQTSDTRPAARERTCSATPRASSDFGW